MSLWRQLVFGARALVRRRQADRDIADEVDHYLELAVAEHEARGLSRDEALRAARIEMGGPTSVFERVRSAGWEHAVGALAFDLRYATRRLVREPLATAALVGTVAIGIGTTTAIFGAVHGVLLRPLPFPEPDRIVTIWDVSPDGRPAPTTFGTLDELASRQRSFERLAALKPWQPTLAGTEVPERLDGQRVSAGYFRILGVAPALGRDFRDVDDRLGGPAEVVVSDGLWRRQLGGDPAVVGGSILLDEREHEVVGVMPPGFADPLAPNAEAWATLQYDLSQGRAWGHHLRMVGRLRPDADLAAGAHDLDRIAEAPIQAFPRPTWAALDNGLLVRSLRDEVTGGARTVLLALLGAAGLLLAIAAVNVTSLLLARDAQRRHAFALRAALGASRMRLMRQLGVEGALSAAIGGALGLLLASLGGRALAVLGRSHLPRAETLAFDGVTAWFGVALIAGIVGIIVWMAAVEGGRSHLRSGIRHRARVLGTARTRGALVVAQVALAVVLLVGSGLLLRSLERLLDVDVGFDPSSVLTLQVDATSGRYPDHEAVHRYFDRLLEEVRTVPGVGAAAVTSQLPLAGERDLYGVHVDGGMVDDTVEERSAFRYTVSPDYFAAMAIPLRAGRLLEATDRAGARPVALISESMARRRFAGAEVIGRRVRLGPPDGSPFTIVGVVGDVRQESLTLSETDAFYVSAEQWHFADRARSLVVRVDGDAGALAPTIRQAIWSVDDQRPIVRVTTLADLVATSLAERRFALILFEAFAGASLLLAVAGIYGLLGGWVAERTRELGVRAALGATRADILVLVMGRGLALAGLGAVFGLAAAALATRVLVALLFHVSQLDPATYAGVLALLAVVALLAGARPAWRAMRVDPATVLRSN